MCILHVYDCVLFFKVIKIIIKMFFELKILKFNMIIFHTHSSCSYLEDIFFFKLTKRKKCQGKYKRKKL